MRMVAVHRADSLIVIVLDCGLLVSPLEALEGATDLLFRLRTGGLVATAPICH